MSDIEAQIADFEAMTSQELRDRWVTIVGGPVPKISPSLLRLALAWELQAKARGGLSGRASRTLDQMGRSHTKTSAATAGMRLVREWNGRAHVVTVAEDQTFLWEGRIYRSLSEVARAITGTKWSGPAFFGLKKKAAA